MISGASEEELTEAIGRTDVLLEFMPKIKQLQQENKQLKDNWKKLKECLHNQIPTDKTVLTKHIKIFEVLDKMQELEQGSDSNGNN